MSRATAKERSRVRIVGRMGTVRKIESFGSWKHRYYFPNEGPVIRQLNRRTIGGRNGGHYYDSDLLEQKKKQLEDPRKIVARELAVITEMEEEDQRMIEEVFADGNPGGMMLFSGAYAFWTPGTPFVPTPRPQACYR